MPDRRPTGRPIPAGGGIDSGALLSGRRAIITRSRYNAPTTSIVGEPAGDQWSRIFARALFMLSSLKHLYGCLLLGIALYSAFGSLTWADENPWQALRSGGSVGLLRHATAPGIGDPPHFRWRIARPNTTCRQPGDSRLAPSGRRCVATASPPPAYCPAVGVGAWKPPACWTRKQDRPEQGRTDPLQYVQRITFTGDPLGAGRMSNFTDRRPGFLCLAPSINAID